MKLVILIFAVLCLWLRLAMGVVPNVIDITLECNPRPTNEQVRAYRFFERIGTNWTFLGSVPTNRFVVTNVNVLVPHTYGVTASNILGESDISAPCLAPTDPRPPSNLNVIQTSLTVPINSTIAATTDFVAWQEKETFRSVDQTNLIVKWTITPRDRVQFWKLWTSPLPPMPGGPP